MADPMTRRMALGCAQLGNLFQARSDDDAADILETAWDYGIRHFDTAPHYGLGLSETRLGTFLRTKPREQFTVSTKVGRLLVSNPSGADQMDDEGFIVPATSRRRWDFSAEGVRASLDASRERLGLERIDTVFVHDPNDFAEQALQEAVPALVALRDSGAIASVGVGNRDTALLTRFVCETDVDAIMLAGRYTLLDQTALDELLPACLRQGVTVMNAAVFNSGILAQDHPGPEARFEYGTTPVQLLQRAQEIVAACERHGSTLPAAALAFSAGHPAVTAVVVGADDAHQVRRNAELLTTPPPIALWDELRRDGLIRADAPTPQHPTD